LEQLIEVDSKATFDSTKTGWGTTSFSCPRCSAIFDTCEIEETVPLACPTCKVDFAVEYKHHLLYLVAILFGSGLIAYLQDLQSIFFWGAVILYSAIGAVVLSLLGFALKLPKRFVLTGSGTSTLGIDRREK
jgi:hypothetical protein